MDVNSSGKLNDAQEALLALLIQGHLGKRPPLWKRSMHEFILEYGWWYEPSPRPKAIEKGPAGQCFRNAFNMALGSDTFIYCEGVIVSRCGLPLTQHGWMTDGDGRAIDVTLDRPAGAYAGVPFQTDFVNEYYLKAHATVCLLDDWAADWPLLGELGDRPQQWLEMRGRGASRCRGNK